MEKYKHLQYLEVRQRPLLSTPFSQPAEWGLEGVQVADVELAGPLVSDQDAGLLCFVVCVCQNALMEAGIPLDLSLGSGNERLQADFEEFRLPDVNGDNMISRKEVREQAGRGGRRGEFVDTMPPSRN